MVPSRAALEMVRDAVRAHFTGDRDSIDCYGAGAIIVARDGAEGSVSKKYRRGMDIVEVIVETRRNADFVILGQDFEEIDAGMASLDFKPGY